jgi:mannosyl-oligosaccharide alpha-1,2-mannosidase
MCAAFACTPGRNDLAEAGMLFWYDLLTMKEIDGLYCQGISTSRGDCQNPTFTIGSAADSMYEYMLKQWILSNKTQEVSSTC